MLHNLLKQSRQAHGYSIEEVAANLNVSPDAIRRWEDGSEIPTSQELANLIVLYELPLKTLYSALKDTEGALQPHQQAVPKAGRIKLAIACQTILLMALVQTSHLIQTTNIPDAKLSVLYLPILAATLWMAYNQRYEKNPTQRRHNTRVELKYCLIQCTIALLGIAFMHPMLAGFALCGASLYYITTVNPTRMNRPLLNE